MVIGLGMDELNVEDLSLGAHSEPSVEVQPSLKEKSTTGDTLVWDSGGSTTKFNHLKWHTEIHPLAKPMTFSSANEGTGLRTHMDTVRFDAPGPDGKPSQALHCPNSPVGLISSGAIKQDGVEHDGISDKLVVKEANRELQARVYWNNNVAIVPTCPPPSLDIEYVDKTIITVRDQKKSLQKLQQDVPDSAGNKNRKNKGVTKASRFLTPEPAPDELPATKPPKASDDLNGTEDFLYAEGVANLTDDTTIPPNNPIMDYIANLIAKRQSRGLQGVDDEISDKENESERRTSQRKRALRFGQEGKKGLYKKPNNRQLDGQAARDLGVETAQSTVWLFCQ
jgi:hypothetical protein